MWCWWTNTWWGCRILWTWPTDLCLTSKDCLKHMLTTSGPPPLDNTQCSPQLPLILLEAWMHEITQHTEFVFKISCLSSILTTNDRNSMYSISMYFNVNKHAWVLDIDSTGLRVLILPFGPTDESEKEASQILFNSYFLPKIKFYQANTWSILQIEGMHVISKLRISTSQSHDDLDSLPMFMIGDDFLLVPAFFWFNISYTVH